MHMDDFWYSMVRRHSVIHSPLLNPVIFCDSMIPAPAPSFVYNNPELQSWIMQYPLLRMKINIITPWSNKNMCPFIMKILTCI